MKIECILRRAGGTLVELPGKTYNFLPQDDGKHVADVEIETHIERFLNIPEAYRLLRMPGADAVSATFAPAQVVDPVPSFSQPAPLLGADGYKDSYEINGVNYALSDIITRAFADSGLSVENWNELEDDTRAVKLDLVLDAIADGEISVPAAVETEPAQPAAAALPDDRASLAVLYQARFGKNPPNTMKIEAIKAKLAAE